MRVLCPHSSSLVGSRFQELEAALAVLDMRHFGAEDFIEDGFFHKLGDDAAPQASGHASSRPTHRGMYMQSRLPSSPGPRARPRPLLHVLHQCAAVWAPAVFPLDASRRQQRCHHQ